MFMITNERIASYIHSLDQELPLYLREIEKEALKGHVPIIKKPAQSLLRFLLHCVKPADILEIGTAVAFSTLLLREFMPADGHITTIEKVEAKIKKARENIELYGENQITLIEGDAADILKQLAVEGKKFDFIFMDAAKGQYLPFLSYVEKLLKKGGILISDNVLQNGDIIESRYAVTRRDRTIHARMREYLYQITHSEEFDTIILPIGDGITISTKMK